MVLKSRNIVIFLILAFPFFFYACDDQTPDPKSIEEERDDDDDNDDPPEGEISFSDDINPIFSEYGCEGCHDGGTPPDLSSNVYDNLLDGYVEPGEPENSDLYNQLDDSGSGNHVISEEDLDNIRQWIEEGAEDN